MASKISSSQKVKIWKYFYYIYIYIHIYMYIYVCLKWTSPYKRPWRPRGEVEVQLNSFFNLGTIWGRKSTPRSGRFTPGKKDPVPIIQGAGWATGPAWTGTENLASTRIRYPDRPAGSDSLHRLRYPGPQHIFKKSQLKCKINHIPLMNVWAG